MFGKIDLEEHLSTPENTATWDDSGEAGRNGAAYTKDIMARLPDVDMRLEEMDRNGIEHSILSLTSPGTQGFPDAAKATDFARATNDYIAEHYVAKDRKRLSAFATVALQDPHRAAAELERAVKDLGAKGALINGYTNLAGTKTIQYLDEEPVWEFWDKVAELNVPVYLHPREPNPGAAGQDGWRLYDGYSSLIGSAWGFAQETASHALRLIMSGVFDQYPNLNVILGHFGEGLSFLLPRCEHRLYMQREGTGLGKNRKRLTDYFRKNFYVTSSGHFRTTALHSAVSEIGEDRVMFSVDYPYENMYEAARWFDEVEMPLEAKQKIAYGNAKRLFHI